MRRIALILKHKKLRQVITQTRFKRNTSDFGPPDLNLNTLLSGLNQSSG